jgi:hypothetical protein
MIQLPIDPPAPRGRFVPAEHAQLPITSAPAPLAADDLVDLLIARIVGPGLPARSAEFKFGLRQRLEHLVQGKALIAPFFAGSPEHDAWVYGVNTGNVLWAWHLDGRAAL